MKRAGLLVLLLAGSIISTELLLSVLRQRNINVDIRVEGKPPASMVSTPAPQPQNTAAPQAGTLYMAPDGSLVVNVIWSYRIGPKFPVTAVRAAVQDKSGDIVASAVYTITCETATSLLCEGQQPLALHFGEKDEAGQPTPWPVGSYTLQVTQASGGLIPLPLVERPIRVAN
jgi:hypothetical protein